MTNYSQRDVRWNWKKLGWGSTNLGSYGCAVTSLAILSNKRPDEVNEILKNNGGFADKNLVIWSRACQLLGLKCGGGVPNIAHVRGNGFPMHFVVWLGNNQIIDPWDGRQKTNPYQFVAFRNVTINVPVSAPTPPPAVAPAPKPAQVIYVVQRGDTLGGIAKKFGTTWQNLQAKNGIKNPNVISVGQRIKI